MNPQVTNIIGYLAGAGTTVSFFPQMIRVVRTGSVQDLSVFMFLIHTTGVTLWIVYGSIIHNIIIVIFNVITMIFNAVILFYFIRDHVKTLESKSISSNESNNV